MRKDVSRMMERAATTIAVAVVASLAMLAAALLVVSAKVLVFALTMAVSGVMWQ